ncbi:TetR/AcrR family transcriptional regulator [Novosphingobium sp. AAP83]|uniref:TetR/AcrR family transcriptional regulator n=1 Tax=Novosphingobium sp. AAP83 TaxID=1523425 RepID=UPI0006B9542A|nr:TetR family transcriptional regulator [Novosphingobium sp. AAP83]
METAAVKTKRKRDDPRREATRAALIEAAERLFAENGADAVSTRQIGAAIGAFNTNVVAYHFGGKLGLIDAVFRHRLPDIDRRRGELLVKADQAGNGENLTVLVQAFALPLFEQTDASGRHSYARFLIGLERSGLLKARALVANDFPETDRLTARMAALLPREVTDTANYRVRLIFAMLGAALQIIDQDQNLSFEAARQQFDNAIAMAVAAYGAIPASQGTSR